MIISTFHYMYISIDNLLETLEFVLHESRMTFWRIYIYIISHSVIIYKTKLIIINKSKILGVFEIKIIIIHRTKLII